MSVDVLVPWAPGCPHREAALAYISQQWKTLAPEYPVILGRAPAEPWCKANAVADALSRSTAEVLVISDADVWTDGAWAAIQRVQEGAPWAIPHGDVHRLTESVTSLVISCNAPPWQGLATAERPYKGFEGGGIVVLRRNVYEAAPLDHRFRGWGQEDESWALALRTLHGEPWRGDAPLFHLWHPPQSRESRRYGSAAGRALYESYQAANGRPDAMRALLREPKGNRDVP